MATSEIEKLERRYAENPQGLTFAPLAEVHRKNGDVARALELLTAGLELHPNYIPASIVLGRCHQDLGDFPSSEAAFAHVLRLDDENVIALKSLADISEREERFGDAENWLRRLVSVDRSNDEAREQLHRLEARKKDAAAAPAPEAVASTPALEIIDLGPEPAAEPPLADIAALELTPAPTPRREVAAAEPPGEPVLADSAPESEEPAPEGEPVPPVAGLISAEFEPPLEAVGGLGVETSEDVVLEVSSYSEFRVPDASEDFKALAERLSAPPPRVPATPVSEAAPTVADEPSRPSPEPKADVAPPSKPEEQIIGVPATRRSYLAQETKGLSVAAFFHSLLAARPPAEGVLGGGHDGGSVTSAAGQENLPVPPAVPAADETSDGAVSFDDFFGSEREGSTPLRQRADPGKDDLDQFQTWLQNLKR